MVPIRVLLQVSIVLSSFESHSFGATTNTLVVPPDRADSFGNSRAGIVSGQPGFYQVLYNPTNFTQLRGNAMLITGIAFRIDDRPDTLNITIPRVEVWASTFTGGTKPTRFPEQNWGSDRAQVFRGENLHFEGVPELDRPDHFQIQLALSRPFSYDPSAGGLLLEFQALESFHPSDSAFTDADVRFDKSAFTVAHFGAGEFVIEGQGDVLQVSFIEIPKLRIIYQGDNQLLVSFLATVPNAYVLEGSSSLGDIWSRIETIAAGPERTVTISIPTNKGSGFYRLEIL